MNASQGFATLKSSYGSCVLVGAANLLQHKVRLAVACSGIAVALFLLMMQAAFLNGAQLKVTQFYRLFDFDLAILPDSYQILWSFDRFNRVRLSQARSVPGVVDTFGINFTVSGWTELPSKRLSSILLFGLDDPAGFVSDRGIRDGMTHLVDSRSILVDAQSQPDIGAIAVGNKAKLNDHEVDIVGLFDLGLFFYAEGSVIVKNTNYALFTGVDPRTVSIGLVRIAKGSDPGAVRAQVAAALPDNVLVLTRDQLMAQETSYFLTTKPIGIMLNIGMLIACLVTIVIVVQVLSTEVGNRLKEYAVLKAMGFSPAFIYGIGIVQAAILGVVGLIPAILAASVVLEIVQYETHMRAALSSSEVGLALAAALGLSLGAAALVLLRIERADPAELY